MPPFHPFSAAPPRGLELRHSSATPTTPEPSGIGDSQPPSPPRRRLRLKRRNVSQLETPTQHFLASVAAANAPIPSIEEARMVDDMLTTVLHTPLPPLGHFDDLSFTERTARSRTFSPPKTPLPRVIPFLSPKHFPDWCIDPDISSRDSSPGCESSRPSTSRSTQTSASLCSRISLACDDVCQCASLENGPPERFLPSCTEDEKEATGLRAPSTRLRKAPWTRAMSQHLWSMYMTYLQDPKVTPFRIGKSGVPPAGVCARVARVAKMTWKGSRPQAKAEHRSRSATPTDATPGPFMQWPHTSASTRAHLRELCKANSATTSRNLQYLAHSPTPYGKTATRFWSRRSAPFLSPTVFSGSEMAMSLAVSTSDSMQAQGPLAQLAAAPPEAVSESPSPGPSSPPALAHHVPEPATRTLLGSPFVARSYGPSSSHGLADSLATSPVRHRHSHTIGTRRSLGSPVRLNHGRGSIQKRRSRQSVPEIRRPKRPGLGSDFWTDPSSASATDQAPSDPAALFAEFCSTDSKLRDNLFVPRTNVQELFEASHPATASMAESATSAVGLSLAAVAPDVAPRLGSPFSARGGSFSFPNRRSDPTTMIDFAAVQRPYATLHQPSADVQSGLSAKPLLTNRLAHPDDRLEQRERTLPDDRYSRSS